MCARATPPESAAGPAAAVRAVVALGGAPAAWTLQTLVSYGMGAYACYPQGHPLHEPLWDGALIRLEWVVTALCLVLGVACAAVAWRWWRKVWRPGAEPASHGPGPNAAEGQAHAAGQADIRTQNTASGRVRFLSMAGLLVSCVFLGALLFTACAPLLMPPCGPWGA